MLGRRRPPLLLGDDRTPLGDPLLPRIESASALSAPALSTASVCVPLSYMSACLPGMCTTDTDVVSVSAAYFVFFFSSSDGPEGTAGIVAAAVSVADPLPRGGVDGIVRLTPAGMGAASKSSTRRLTSAAEVLLANGSDVLDPTEDEDSAAAPAAAACVRAACLALSAASLAFFFAKAAARASREDIIVFFWCSTSRKWVMETMGEEFCSPEFLV